MALSPQDIADRLLAQRGAFKGFLRSRLHSDADAEDLLQIGLLKALERSGDLRDETRLEAWFYQLLRTTLIDHERSRHAALQREGAWLNERETDEALRRHACACLAGVVSTLIPAHAALVDRVELQGQSLAEASAAANISSGNASVILHRARKEIRKRLELICGECAEHSCRDCDCDA